MTWTLPAFSRSDESLVGQCKLTALRLKKKQFSEISKVKNHAQFFGSHWILHVPKTRAIGRIQNKPLPATQREERLRSMSGSTHFNDSKIVLQFLFSAFSLLFLILI